MCLTRRDNYGQRSYTGVPAAAVASAAAAGQEASAIADMIDTSVTYADQGSDHDADVELSGATGGEDEDDPALPKICGSYKHKWKHDQCMVCSVCGECTG